MPCKINSRVKVEKLNRTNPLLRHLECKVSASQAQDPLERTATARIIVATRSETDDASGEIDVNEMRTSASCSVCTN